MENSGQPVWVGDSDFRARIHTGTADGDYGSGLVFDATAVEPSSWDELTDVLTLAFESCQRAAAAQGAIVLLLDEPSLFGLRSPLRSALGTALLGGGRSLAAEFLRKGGSCAIATVSNSSVERAALLIPTLLSSAQSNGITVNLGDEHIGRPAP
jgi:hypothetical protein